MNSFGVPRSAVSPLAEQLERLATEIRNLESEVGPERAWTLIEAHDNLIDLTSDDRNTQIEGAKRLALSMIPPRLEPAGNASLTAQAKTVGLGPGGYLLGVVFPEGLLLAVGRMTTPDIMRIGRNWVVDEKGKITEACPVYDLSIADFVQWLHSQASKASDAILTNRTYPDDPLDQTQKEPDDHDIYKATISEPGLAVVLFSMDMDSTAGKILAIESSQEASTDVDRLLRKTSKKESAMVRNARDRDGDLVGLLRDEGKGASEIRVIRVE